MRRACLLVAAFAWATAFGDEVRQDDNPCAANPASETNGVRCLSVDEAIRAVNDVYAHAEAYKSERNRRLMCRLLTDGFAAMTYEVGDGYFGNGAQKSKAFRYEFIRLVPELGFPARSVWGREPFCPGQCFDVDVAYGKLDQTEEVRGWTTRLASLGTTGLDESLRSFGVSAKRMETVVREVVADVETVRLVALTNLAEDPTATLPAPDESEGPIEALGEESAPLGSPKATYLVTLRVRSVLQGSADFKRFAFRAVLDSPAVTRDNAWLFYRGLTLAVGFAESNGVEQVVRIDPVLPYPPFAKEDIRVYDRVSTADENGPCTYENEAFLYAVRYNGHVPLERSLCLNYGDHTFAQFSSGTNLVSGLCGDVPDFGPSVRIEVWTDGLRARPDYWTESWFSWSHAYQSWARSPVRVKPALDYYVVYDNGTCYDNGACEFSWRGIKLPSVAFRPPATMQDVAEFLTQATASFGEGRRRFRVMADESCARRTVRPYAAENVLAYPLLDDVCRFNGCEFDVKGTNVTIKAKLSEAEMTPPDLDVLFGELSQLGFASVANAEYARGALHANLGYEFMNEECSAVQSGYFVGWPGRSGLTWTRPVPGVTNRVEVLVFDCLWWNVSCAEEKTNAFFWSLAEGTVRLRRDIAKLIFALEEGAWVSTDRALAFALQLHSAGYRSEAKRIVELLWQCPTDAVETLEKLRSKVRELTKRFPTVDVWMDWLRAKQAERKTQDEGVAESGKVVVGGNGRNADSDECCDEDNEETEEEDEDDFYF